MPYREANKSIGSISNISSYYYIDLGIYYN